MSSEESVLKDIHLRNMLQDLKDNVLEEVGVILDKKLLSWPSMNGINYSSNGSGCQLSETCCCCKARSRQGSKESGAVTDDLVAASWSPDYHRALHQLKRTNALTKALTRSHSTVSHNAGGRVFISRPSLLTELLEVSHICSVYNIFVAILCLLLVHELLEEVITTGSLNLELGHMMWCFGQMDKVIVIWLGMFLASSVGVYSGLHYWAYNRHRNSRAFDVVFGMLFLAYLCLLLHLPTNFLLHYNLPLASSFIVLCEQIRFMMKSWAFVRSNIPRALHFNGNAGSYKKTDGDLDAADSAGDSAADAAKDINAGQSSPSGSLKQNHALVPMPKCADFSQHLYFLFAPTLVYKDEYPRCASIRWGHVAADFVQVLGCILYTHFIFVRFCVPVFQQFGKQPHFNGSQLLVSVFSSCFPASLVLLCGFFAVLHAWLNAFAEMLRFSDRMFYKDWWNSTSYARFYRTWNCVVHDWLYEYVYRELQADKHASRLRRHLPLLLVFLISATVHEYVVAFAFRFFYPVLLCMFLGFGVVFVFVRTRARQFNVLLWVTLILGTGILMCLYSLEWYARRNCLPVHDGFTDYLVPRSWFCISLGTDASQAPAAGL